MNLMIWLRSREYTYHLIMKRNSIMKSDSADTIAQALAVYNNRH